MSPNKGAKESGDSMIRKVKTKSELRRFVRFTKTHYPKESFFVQPFLLMLERELTPKVLRQKTYTALLAYSEQDQIQGRLLYTLSKDTHRNELTCFFSFFEAIDDQTVVNALFQTMEDDMKQAGVIHAEGTFAPYDPDTRRGILVEGFDTEPTVFTSYNHPYYKALMEGAGFAKIYDTVAIGTLANERSIRAAEALGSLARRRFEGRIDALDVKNVDRDIEDIHTILKEATTEINYQEAPSIEMIRAVAKHLKPFIAKDLVLIAREKDTNTPVGFTMAIPDFNQLFKKAHGRFRPLWFYLHKKEITRVRGMLQYVVPKYQGTGLLGALYAQIYAYFPTHGINDFEAGTIMEANLQSTNAFSRFGLTVRKVYRIYGKDLAS
jgi:GNAT superfamily N-acetyltransferase